MTETRDWREKLRQTNWSQVTGVMFFLLVVWTMLAGYQQIVEWLTDDKQVPLRHVVVTGDLKNVTPRQVSAKVFETKVGSFFSVDVNRVQAAIESLPWVYRVSVRKKWPDVLNIHVTEQQSVAIWNDDQLLNTQGDVFQAHLADDSLLPKLYGPEGSETDALKGYQDLNQLLSINGFNIDELTLSARFSWQLTLKNGVLLDLGREETVKRVQRFIDLYETIAKRRTTPVKSVDLRYDTGMAVRWVQQS